MADGDTREFVIDKDNKPDCQLDTNEITIKKSIVNRPLNKRLFEVVGLEKSAFIFCFPGFVMGLMTEGKAEKCGIGKIFMKLCLNEDTIHDVSNKQQNRAMKEIDNFKGPDHELLKEWANFKCKKIIYLIMSTKNAYVYFNSAIESKYDEMFIKISNKKGMYPKSGPCSVEVLKERYNEDGQMVDDDETVDVHKKNWYFCMPYEQSSSSTKCK